MNTDILKSNNVGTKFSYVIILPDYFMAIWRFLGQKSRLVNFDFFLKWLKAILPNVYEARVTNSRDAPSGFQFKN